MVRKEKTHLDRILEEFRIEVWGENHKQAVRDFYRNHPFEEAPKDEEEIPERIEIVEVGYTDEYQVRPMDEITRRQLRLIRQSRR